MIALFFYEEAGYNKNIIHRVRRAGGPPPWTRYSDTSMIGDQLRENLLNPILGKWHISSWMMGETVPLEKNHVRLHPELKDKYGIPQLIISCEWSENEDKMVEDYVAQSKEMLRKPDLPKSALWTPRTIEASSKNRDKTLFHRRRKRSHEYPGAPKYGLPEKSEAVNTWVIFSR